MSCEELRGAEVIRKRARRATSLAIAVVLNSAYQGCEAATDDPSTDPDASLSTGSDASDGPDASLSTGSDASDGSVDPNCTAVPIAGEALFPDATLVDWVSFADHLASIEVASEAVIPPPDSVANTGEGYVGRKLLVKVTSTLWSNPFAQALPPEIEFNGWGWLKRQSCMSPVYGGRDHPAPRLEVGGKYMIALVMYTKSGDGWGPLTPGSAWADSSDPVANADVASTGINSVAEMLSAMTPAQVHGILESTPPYPSVREDLGLPAEERLARATLE